MASLYLFTQLATELRGHCPLQSLEDQARHGTVICEQLGAIADWDAGALADELVVRRFINVLKPPPPAYVVNQHRPKQRKLHDILEQTAQPTALPQSQSASASILVGGDNSESMLQGIFGYHFGLILNRVLLVIDCGTLGTLLWKPLPEPAGRASALSK